MDNLIISPVIFYHLPQSQEELQINKYSNLKREYALLQIRI